MSTTASAPEAAERAPADCTSALSASLTDQDEAERIAQALESIADPTRLQLLRLIGATPNGESCACDLAEHLGRRQPTISHHLKIMTGARLLHRERRGIRVRCALDHNSLDRW